MSVDDRRRAEIEEEERVRADVRKKIAAEGAKKKGDTVGKGCLTLIGIFVGLAILGSLGGEKDRGYDKYDFSAQCESMITKQLKAPTTAQFQSSAEKYGSGLNAIRETSSGFEWLGVVDAQNGFGAMIRSTFVCSHDKASGSVKANIVN